MRILIDMQGAQSESRFRGIGRYTLSLTKAIVRNRGKHEIILALNGMFSDTTATIRADFENLLPQENIFVWYAPAPVRQSVPDNAWRSQIAELLREAFIASLNPDVVYLSSLFEGYVDDALTSICQFDKVTPVCVTFYDLIPLLNPDSYFKPNPNYEKYYRKKIGYLSKANLLLSISESSRQEGLSCLDVEDNNIVNISTAADGCFCPISIDAGREQNLRKKFGLIRPFVLYTGGADERKNLSRLIRAYAKLSLTIRETHQLVFAGNMSEGQVYLLRAEAKSAGLHADELCFTGYVSDDDLVGLYNLCKLFVFPSWHEGFGLPALEAMSCGAAVIAANTSSIPEVIGFKDALFDPYSSDAIAQKISDALTDEAFRNSLIEFGKTQSVKFSWDGCARRAISAFEKFQNPNPPPVKTWAEISNALADRYRSLIQGIATLSPAVGNVPKVDLLACAAAIARNNEALEMYHRATVLPDTITWRIEGPFDSSYSLAIINRETALALDALGHHVVLHSTEGPGDFSPNPDFLKAHPQLSVLYERSASKTQDDAHVVSRNLYPPRVSDLRSRLNLLHQYAWEESGFPQEWAEQFNDYLQGITCISRHVQKILIDNGVRVPCSISGDGVDHWERIVPDKNYKIDGRAFRFLHVSSCFPRKGADVLLHAYGQAFTALDDVTLIIKTFDNPHNEIHRWLAEARAGKSDYPDVQVIEEILTDNELKSLYLQCHTLVAPSRAEGFGLPLAEAMLTGLPVITTGWSGQLDFCTENTAWLVDYRFESADSHFELFDSVWAEPDVSCLAEKMREVFELSPDERCRKPDAGRRFLLENFRWRHVAERMVNSARAWSTYTYHKEPHIGWITTWNTRCGIAVYSKHLIDNLSGPVTVLAAKSTLLTEADGRHVVRCWEQGDHEDLAILHQEILRLRFNTLVIQFNYGFFDFENFGRFLCQQVDSGCVVVVMMHATIDPPNAPHKKLETLVPALARCHRVLVHTAGDLNRLKKLGLTENVSIFPHGILDYQSSADRGKPSDIFQVASYGFFLPNKGLLELIDAVSLLKDDGVNIRLNMVNAEYPILESSQWIDQARKKIKKNGLMHDITLYSDFLSDQESLKLLRNADLIVFPYQKTAESSSAAVRYGLATGRPVAVTPLSIFDDVKCVVHALPGLKAADIARGIAQVMKDVRSGNGVFREKEKTADRWREAHSYAKLGPRLYNILKALPQTSVIPTNK